jgi:DNA polymerase
MQMNTYDIVNAGPKNRFRCNGRIVSNSGRTFQPQNLPRPTLKQSAIEFGIDALKAGCADLITDNVMQLTSSAIRGCMAAPEGKKLVVADLSNIEGRVLAWLAGETWKLKAFRDFDEGKGPDLYKLAYGKSFGVDPKDVTKDQRQIGKVQELAFGFASGVNGVATFASAYGIDLDDLSKRVIPAAPGWAVDEAREFYEWRQKKGDVNGTMSEDAFVTCDTLKRVWRNAHPETVALWAELEAACFSATGIPGTTFTCRRLKVRRDGNWLRIGLPSGRSVCYPAPELSDDGLSYMGMNQYSRKWCRLRTYGGKLVENCTQAVARDVMAANMAQIEREGYAIVISIHDELLTETPDTAEFNEDHLASLLAACPAWAADMPLAAAGFQAYRYRKD